MPPPRQPAPVNADLRSAIATLLCDQPIAYHPVIARAIGSVTAGVLLSQLLYWTPRSRDGWIWKTQPEITRETGLSRWEQETARKTLKAAGILHEQRRGSPARLFYRIDVDALGAAVAGLEDADFPQSSRRQSTNLDCGKTTNKNVGSPQSLHLTEITAKTTTETTIRSEASSALADPGQGATPDLDAAIAEASDALGNTAKLTSNTTRARNLLHRSSIPEPAMVALVHNALTETQQRQHQLKSPAAYFFAILAAATDAYRPPKARGSLAGRYAHLVHRLED